MPSGENLYRGNHNHKDCDFLSYRPREQLLDHGEDQVPHQTVSMSGWTARHYVSISGQFPDSQADGGSVPGSCRSASPLMFAVRECLRCWLVFAHGGSKRKVFVTVGVS